MKPSLRDLNPGLYLPHPTSTYTCEVIIASRACGVNNSYLLTLSGIWRCKKEKRKKKKLMSFEVLVFRPLKNC